MVLSEILFPVRTSKTLPMGGEPLQDITVDSPGFQHAFMTLCRLFFAWGLLLYDREHHVEDGRQMDM